MRGLLTVVLIAGCGRVNFDRGVGGGDGDAGPDGPVVGSPLRVGERPDADITAVTADDSLIDDNFGDNCGACNNIYSGPGEVGLLRFDLTGADVRVVAAAIEVVNIGIPDVNDGDVEVYQILEAWDEGDRTSQGSGVANWQFRQPGVPWSGLGATGASRAASPLATFIVRVPDDVIRIELPVAMVQSWIDDPPSNNGIGFYGRNYSGAGGDHPHLRSRESDPADQRPLLDLLVE